MDDAILLSPHSLEIHKSLQELQSQLKLTEEGDIASYLGLRVFKLQSGDITLSQPQLIASFLKDLNFSENTKHKSIPAASTHLLQRDQNGEPFNEHWDYRSVVGKLKVLEKSSRPDIALECNNAPALHQIQGNPM